MSSVTGDTGSKTARAALFVAVVVGLTFAGAVLSGEQFYFRDLSQNHGPILEGARALLRSGEGLWWNPWAGGGQPLISNPNNLLLHPAGVLALFLPPGMGLTASILLGSILGAVFVALLLRDAGRSPWGAATGALVFGLSGCFLSLGTFPNLLAAASWVPPALFFIRRGRKNLTWLPAAVISSAFVFVPCEPASAIVLVVFTFLPLEGGRNGDATNPARRFREGARAAAILASGSLAAAYQVLPALLWIRASARGEGLSGAETLKWSLEARRLPEVILPGFLGDPSIFKEWWGGGLFETGFPLMLSLYVGVPALLLAVFGTWARLRASETRRGFRRENLPSLAVPLGGVFFLLLATGRFFPILLGFVPGGAVFRYPEKFLLGAVLAVALQAAIGVDWLLTLHDPRPDARPGARRLGILIGPRRDLHLLCTAAGIAVALQVVSFVVQPAWADRWFHLTRASGPLGAAAHDGVPASIGLAAVATSCFALAVLFLPLLSCAAREITLSASVALSLLMGALVVGPPPVPWRVRANPSWSRAALQRGPFFPSHLARLRDEGGRLFRPDRPAGFGVKTRTGTLVDGFSWDRRSLSRSSASEFAVELAYDRTTDQLNPRGAAAALQYLTGRPAEEQARFWDLAGVQLVLSYTPLDLPGMILVDELLGESTPPLLLYENRRALPRVRLVDGAYRVASDLEAFERIRTRGEEGRGEVRLVIPPGADAPPPLPEGGLSADGSGVERRSIVLSLRGAGRIRVKVGAISGIQAVSADRALRAAWLVISENDVPGWRATVDGRPAPIYRADGMQMALSIPDGAEHEVCLSFFPPGFLAGLALSVATVGLAILVGAASSIARRRARYARG